MLTGRCLCGRVRFEVQRLAGPIVYCHCENCRRQAGSPIAAWADVRAADFRWTAEAPSLYVYEGDLGPETRRRFCGHCGSSLTWERGEEGVDVAVGAFDDLEALQPTAHCFAGAQVRWLRLDDDLPRHVQGNRSPILERGGAS